MNVVNLEARGKQLRVKSQDRTSWQKVYLSQKKAVSTFAENWTRKVPKKIPSTSSIGYLRNMHKLRLAFLSFQILENM